MKASNSSVALPLWQKVSELIALFRMHMRGVFHPPDLLSKILEEFEEYNTLLQQYSHITLENAKAFEIGFGAQPYRLITLMSFGVDAAGVERRPGRIYRDVSQKRHGACSEIPLALRAL